MLKEEKATAKDLIRNALSLAILTGFPWKAVHELRIVGVSECAASARLREMARTGEVAGRYREGKTFKEWMLLTVSEN